MSFTIRRKSPAAPAKEPAVVKADTVFSPTATAANTVTNGSERYKEYHQNVPLDTFVHFFGNDPDRVNRALADFQAIVTAFREGRGVRGPIKAVRCPRTGKNLVVNGHRSLEASRDAGFGGIDAVIIYPRPGETAEQVQMELFALDNENRPYKGKAKLRTAILTKGATLMGSDIRRVWGIIQKYQPNERNLEWMAAHAAPDLVKITESVLSYIIFARMKDGETTTYAEQREFFWNSMTTIKLHEVQRETRDYVTERLGTNKATRVLENALVKNTVPDAVLTEKQKNKEKDEAKAKKAAAKRAKARAQVRAFREG